MQLPGWWCRPLPLPAACLPLACPGLCCSGHSGISWHPVSFRRCGWGSSSTDSGQRRLPPLTRGRTEACMSWLPERPGEAVGGQGPGCTGVQGPQREAGLAAVQVREWEQVQEGHRAPCGPFKRLCPHQALRPHWGTTKAGVGGADRSRLPAFTPALLRSLCHRLLPTPTPPLGFICLIQPLLAKGFVDLGDAVGMERGCVDQLPGQGQQPVGFAARIQI